MFEQDDVVIVACSKISVRFQLVENCVSKASIRNKEEVLGEDLACVDFFAQSGDGETRAGTGFRCVGLNTTMLFSTCGNREAIC